MTKKYLKNFIFRTLTVSPRLQYRKYKLTKDEVITVLNFHRVSPNKGSTYSPLSPDIFNEIIKYLKKEFHICLFNDVYTIQTLKPKLIISFDDGYKDFIDYAVPILDKHKVRVNQNVIPYCIETGFPPVNVLLQDFIGKAPSELLKKLPLDINTSTYDRAALGKKASFSIKYLSESDFIPCRDHLLDFLKNYPEFLCASVMNKKDIIELSSTHEIGAHSFEHLSMENQSKEYFLNDLKKCKEYFSNHLNLYCGIYAFPNGSATDEQVLLAKKHGYESVLLVGDKYTSINDGVFNRFTFDANSIYEAKYKAFGRRMLIS